MLYRKGRYFGAYAEQLADALRRLGAEVETRNESQVLGDQDATLVVGLHEFDRRALRRMARRSLLVGVQTEQLATPQQGAEEFGGLRRPAIRRNLRLMDAVFDWSRANARSLAAVHPVAEWVPYGLCEADIAETQMRREPAAEQFDVVFLGDVHALDGRRQRILTQLASRFSVNPQHGGSWGAKKLDVLRSGRIVLNLHVEASGTFESPRFYDAMGAGVPVVSEPVLDPAPFESDRDFLEVNPATLVPTIERLLGDDSLRLELIENALRTVRQHGMERSAVAILRRILIAHSRHRS